MSLLTLLCLTGCSFKADPAPSAGFANAGLLSSPSDIPFQKSWRKQDVKLRDYQEIYVAPINTDYLMQMTWWQETGRGRKIEEDIDDLAGYAHEALQKAFMEDPRQTFKVVTTPSNRSIVLEFALIEVVPSKAALKAAGLVPAIALPATLLSLTSRSSAAFEARIRDGYSGEILGLFADRQAAKISVFNIKNYMWYSHAKSIIDEWAAQFVKVLSKDSKSVVKGSSWFELKPW